MIPRFGPPPGRRAYRLRPGAYALLIRDGAALLTFQQRPAPEFQLPGGGVDAGESHQAALHREVQEETGWSIGTPRRLGVYRRFCYMPDYGFWAEKLCSVWLARPLLRLGPPQEPGHEAHWRPLSQVEALLPDPGSRAFVRLALAQHRGATTGAPGVDWRRPALPHPCPGRRQARSPHAPPQHRD